MTMAANFMPRGCGRPDQLSIRIKVRDCQIGLWLQSVQYSNQLCVRDFGERMVYQMLFGKPGVLSIVPASL